MSIFFITGPSGVGKSTLVKLLAERLPKDFKIYDFDDSEIAPFPDTDGEYTTWRKQSTAHWTKTCLENKQNRLFTVVSGMSYPSEVLVTAAEEIKGDLKFIYLEVAEDEMRERLFAHRFSTPERVAKLKEKTDLGPEEFIKKHIIDCSKLKTEVEGVGGAVIDTTLLSPEEVASKLIEILK